MHYKYFFSGFFFAIIYNVPGVFAIEVPLSILQSQLTDLQVIIGKKSATTPGMYGTIDIAGFLEKKLALMDKDLNKPKPSRRGESYESKEAFVNYLMDPVKSIPMLDITTETPLIGQLVGNRHKLNKKSQKILDTILEKVDELFEALGKKREELLGPVIKKVEELYKKINQTETELTDRNGPFSKDEFIKELLERFGVRDDLFGGYANPYYLSSILELYNKNKSQLGWEKFRDEFEKLWEKNNKLKHSKTKDLDNNILTSLKWLANYIQINYSNRDMSKLHNTKEAFFDDALTGDYSFQRTFPRGAKPYFNETTLHELYNSDTGEFTDATEKDAEVLTFLRNALNNAWNKKLQGSSRLS